MCPTHTASGLSRGHQCHLRALEGAAALPHEALPLVQPQGRGLPKPLSLGTGSVSPAGDPAAVFRQSSAGCLTCASCSESALLLSSKALGRPPGKLRQLLFPGQPPHPLKTQGPRVTLTSSMARHPASPSQAPSHKEMPLPPCLQMGPREGRGAQVPPPAPSKCPAWVFYYLPLFHLLQRSELSQDLLLP